MGTKNEKCIAGAGSSFVFRAPFFVFRILCRGRHSREISKDFVVYFFAALIKHEIHMKCEKCFVSVSYFVVCFAKNTREIRKVYSRPYSKWAALRFILYVLTSDKSENHLCPNNNISTLSVFQPPCSNPWGGR